MISNWLVLDYENFHSSEKGISWYWKRGFLHIYSSPVLAGIFGKRKENGA